MGRVLSLDEWTAGADANDGSVCCWFVGASSAFELENEEDEDDELLEPELDEAIEDEEEPVDAWEEEIAAAFEESDGPFELASEQ